MIKDKVLSLTKYLSELKNRLSSDTPVKHVNRPIQYKEFLVREISRTEATLDRLKGKV